MMPMDRRATSKGNCARSWPSNRTWPPSMGHSRNKATASVDFPEPVRPTTARRSLRFRVKDTEFSASGKSGWYRRDTFWNISNGWLELANTSAAAGLLQVSKSWCSPSQGTSRAYSVIRSTEVKHASAWLEKMQLKPSDTARFVVQMKHMPTRPAGTCSRSAKKPRPTNALMKAPKSSTRTPSQRLAVLKVRTAAELASTSCESRCWYRLSHAKARQLTMPFSTSVYTD
mmetsp:Transcript_78503/g.188258  ORF Transcript_78503/g.188258 Transcript_78503/m.188258 type:complete len:229 (-) Transcript_78503:2647-3333(-)